MTNYIYSNLPNAEDLLALEPEELAGVLLEYFNSLSAQNRGSIHPDNLTNPNSPPVNQYPPELQDGVARALMEAWELLIRENLLARKPGSPGWYFLTRRGERIKNGADLQAYRQAQVTQRIKHDAPLNEDIVISWDEPTLVGGRYRILRNLAASDFSKTFLAEDTYVPSNRHCVVKQFAYSSPDQASEQMMIQRFNDEAAVLERLAADHDLIPDLYAHFSERNRLYIVQEYIEGETIAERVATSGVFEETEVKEILTNVLHVLQYIHAHSIIHRDIKPNNIVIRKKDSKPVLIDFGAIKKIARTLVDPLGHASTSISIGTLGYMAPEQAVGRPRFASDIYALGFTTIFMLTGKGPEDLNDLRSTVVNWREYARVSPPLDGILDKAISWDFRDRFLEVQDMIQALEIGLPNIDENANVTSSEQPSTWLRSDLGDRNMPEVATWWLTDFLGPIIGIIDYVRSQFSSNSFTLIASAVQPYSSVYDYKVDFFRQAVWLQLMESDLAEYFLSRYPAIRGMLRSFETDMKSFDKSFAELVRAIETSQPFLKKLKDAYANLVQHERIPRSNFDHFDLQQIAVQLLGQLHLQVSNYGAESKALLVRFTAYALLGLNVNFPTNSLPEDHKLPGFCRDALKDLSVLDPSVADALEDAQSSVKKIQSQSISLWTVLRQRRLEIASRYNAKF